MLFYLTKQIRAWARFPVKGKVIHSGGNYSLDFSSVIVYALVMKHYTESDLRSVLRQRLESGPAIRASLVRASGIQSSHLSDIKAGRRPISERLAEALGYEKLPDCYVRKP